MPKTAITAAMKPPTLMMPLVLAIRSGGLDVRPTSKPIIEAGPPQPQATTSTTSSHSGASPGHASTAVQASAIAAIVPSATVDRCQGWLPTTQPRTGPDATTATMIRLSNAPATVSERPSLSTRKGKPQSITRTWALNGVVKCTQKPSRVPGWDQEARRRRRSASPATSGGRARAAPPGSRGRRAAGPPAAAARRPPRSGRRGSSRAPRAPRSSAPRRRSSRSGRCCR